MKRGLLPNRRGGACVRVAVLGAILAASAAVAGAPAAVAGPAQAAQQALVPGPTPAAAETDGTALLSEADAARYRDIFRLQSAGDMDGADRLIARLEDRLLLGHVLAQRYLHPTAWRSTGAELRDWLALYADHPEADRIHALARQRGATGAQAPAGQGELTGRGGVDHQAWLPRSAYKHLSEKDRKTAIRLWANFRKWLSRGATLNAREIVESEEAKRLLTRLDHDRMRAALGYAYFIDGMDDRALEWAKRAVDGSGDRAPTGYWAAGLAEWRAGHVDKAAAWFEKLARSENASPWLRAGGGYWAARAYLRQRKPDAAYPMLQAAAEEGRTFYGLLARRALGLPLPFQWRGGGLSQAEAAALGAHDGGRRAMALAQVGERERCEAELRRLYPGADRRLAGAITALAEVAEMPGLALRLGYLMDTGDDPDSMNGAMEAAQYGGHAGAFYPIPPWTPINGWAIDRALVYAFIRQESGFNPDARSWAGARGLMQLMPGTAALMRSATGISLSEGGIDEPSINLALGQAYIDRLLSEPAINGNLFFLAAAYNAGPGNLQKWVGRGNFQNDPLLFIESMPSRETRVFIERVLANLWIYRHRMGQSLASLDSVVAGEWPLYTAADREDPTTAGVHNVQDY